MEIINKGQRRSKQQRKEQSKSYKIHNLRENYKNYISEKDRIRSAYGQSNNYEVLIYAHPSIFGLVQKAYHKGFDSRIYKVLPDIPTEIFAARYEVPNIVKEALKMIQKHLDLRHLSKALRYEYIRRIITKAMVDFPVIGQWLQEFMLWYKDPNRYQKTTAGHQEVVIRLLEPNS